MNRCHIAIIGAGPYGLSIAAQLRARNVDFRIFGRPMSTWNTQMPKGMKLKSEGFASDLFDADRSFTLGKYSEENKLPYKDAGLPVPLDTFIAYGVEFQKRRVPELEEKLVMALDRVADGFQLTLEDGEVVTAKQVVVAVGICHFAYIPPELATLPANLVSHSSAHSELSGFRGRDVVVIGAGASAVDLAALLHEAGARVQLAARKPNVKFHDPPTGKKRTLKQRLMNPMTGIGPGWKLVFCAHMPWAFRLLPEATRLKAVKKLLGPAPGWFVKDMVVGKVPLHLATKIERVSAKGSRVQLELSKQDGSRVNLEADHVIAATGYRVNLQRLAFLSAGLQSQIRTVEQSPVLSSHFESSVPDLFFVGTSAANTFGPLMRFAVGADFTARTLSQHLAANAPRKSVWQNPPVADSKSMERDEVSCR